MYRCILNNSLPSDMYQINMAYAYWKSDVDYLKSTMAPSVEDDFFNFLKNLSADDVTLYAIDEGNVVFPRVPLIIVEGPLIVVQLLETTLLNLVNFSSLIATNAARYRMAAGSRIQLLEFGLRRAQGPDGGLSASRYAYIGGFDGTSNVLAGKLYGIPVKGTHAHAYVSSYSSLNDLAQESLAHKDGSGNENLKDLALKWRKSLSKSLNILEEEASNGELAAFISFAISFPFTFLALVDTYDVVKSGLLNFCAVALGLNELGYRSTWHQNRFRYKLDWFADVTIVASNDINEETIISLNEQGHKIDCFGIGTHLVTCQRQPALGCVYKLVEINNEPKIKLSQDVEKVTCPGKKVVYRLYGSDGHALIDLMQRPQETPPEINSKVLCRHPFQESKRAYVSPAKIENLHKIYWKDGKVQQKLPTLEEIKERVNKSLLTLRQDHKRTLNPTPFKVSVSDDLYNFLHDLWLQNAPIGELF
ncbi:Nicotinate phosphoribosyltransferase [Armadillidium nasatum]|uniref:Nicotinate phosphoribosyltransferase n=1 Tax=Armadillidium nasatum TaxID=96803 RepID=A0A5N5T5D8_9CRUS|nr:Nicotinate phosphoribosyltransferase [Armadillidium nasatum]